MTIWVWAQDEDNALEVAYDCGDYKTEEEARRKDPNDGEGSMSYLFKIEVTRQ